MKWQCPTEKCQKRQPTCLPNLCSYGWKFTYNGNNEACNTVMMNIRYTCNGQIQLVPGMLELESLIVMLDFWSLIVPHFYFILWFITVVLNVL